MNWLSLLATTFFNFLAWIATVCVILYIALTLLALAICPCGYYASIGG